jgi:DMSO/TMAO reductase YedYZ molybdopterin-dependent catalytic subunit
MADTGGLLDKVKAKLVETKQKWANEGRLLTGESAAPTLRLPPGQREVKNWPVLDLGIQPEIAPDAWRLEIDGLVETPLVLDYAGFQALPQVRMVSDIHCVTQWSRFDNAWEGVATRALLDRVRPKPEAGFVLQTAHDGYTTNLPLADFAGEDVLLAHRWEGAPISAAHGGPVRLVLPKLYFWKSAKWLTRLSFVAADQPGFWEQRGYHMRGDPWKEERYG